MIASQRQPVKNLGRQVLHISHPVVQVVNFFLYTHRLTGVVAVVPPMTLDCAFALKGCCSELLFYKSHGSQECASPAKSVSKKLFNNELGIQKDGRVH